MGNPRDGEKAPQGLTSPPHHLRQGKTNKRWSHVRGRSDHCPTHAWPGPHAPHRDCTVQQSLSLSHTQTVKKEIKRERERGASLYISHIFIRSHPAKAKAKVLSLTFPHYALQFFSLRFLTLSLWFLSPKNSNPIFVCFNQMMNSGLGFPWPSSIFKVMPRNLLFSLRCVAKPVVILPCFSYSMFVCRENLWEM